MTALGALPADWGPGYPAGGSHQVTLRSLPTGEHAVQGSVAPPLGPGTNQAAEWPLLDYLEFGALPGAVPCGRLHTRNLLWEWRLAGLTEGAELVVSELLTNAVAASRPSPDILPVRLWLLSDAARLLILVWDTSPQPPLPSHTSEEAESGRGLLLVEAVCAEWDWYPTPGPGGKAVWGLCGR